MTGAIKISFDLSELVKDFSIPKNQVPRLMQNSLRAVSDAIQYNWREEANKALHSTRNMYMNAIQEPKIDRNTAVVALIGTLPNMMESGINAFDMKTGFKKSAKVVYKKSGAGWYITIPFRWATSGAVGEALAFSNKMPESVENIFKKKPVVYGKAGSKHSSGLKESELPSSLQGKRGLRPEIKNVYGEYKHKSNIFEGIQKQQKTYEKVSQSKYMSFRRVSDLSDPNSWIHPGFTALNLAEKAIRNTKIETIVTNEVESFLYSIGL